MHSSQLIAINV